MDLTGDGCEKYNTDCLLGHHILSTNKPVIILAAYGMIQKCLELVNAWKNCKWNLFSRMEWFKWKMSTTFLIGNPLKLEIFSIGSTRHWCSIHFLYKITEMSVQMVNNPCFTAHTKYMAYSMSKLILQINCLAYLLFHS